uniref:alanine--tRNA ligase n=1 Tax=Trichloromonas sp. TaxID=3069249 RepID=UPI003D8130C4
GRGYVLRRIMRRAMRHAKMLGCEEPLLFQSAVFVLESMADAYPEEAKRRDFVAKVVKNEEERFIQTLDNGLRILSDEIAKLKSQQQTIIPGDVVFRLYDTFGFPVDLTADIVEKDGYTLDEAGFDACMERQRKKARENWKGSGEEAVAAVYRKLLEAGLQSEFTGYHGTTSHGTVTAILKDGQPVDAAEAGDQVEIITSQTPFYGESGGQAGDRGRILTANAELDVIETRKPLPELPVHLVKVGKGTLRKGDTAELQVDEATRQATALNHTATHILQAVLIDVLGDHVKQAGSLVTPDRLRFDFTHFSAMTAEEIARVEVEVNRRIRENQAVDSTEMDNEEAIAAGATALFGEKYGDRVRVVRVGEFSMELCGGTHARAAGDIGLFKILQETGIAAGVRRIEAATGARALAIVQSEEKSMDQMAALLKSDRPQLQARLQKLLERQREMEREIEMLQGRLNAGQAGELLSQIQDAAGVKLLAVEITGSDAKGLREMADQLRDRLQSGVVVLGCKADDKASLLVAVTKDLTGRLHAGNIIRVLAEQVGGKGGGRPDLAQAGGSQPENLAAALGGAKEVICAALQGN